MAITDRIPALRSRDLRLIISGQAISMVGTQMQQVGVAWQLWELTHDAALLGVLGLFRVVPIILFGLGGGVVADAFDRRRLLIVTQTALAAASAGLAALSYFGHPSAPAIYALTALAGTASAFDAPTRQSLIPLLVPREHLASALSLNTSLFQFACVAGPALGGIVLKHFGLVTIYLCDVLSFGAVITALLMLEHRSTGHSTVSVKWSSALEGLRFLQKNPLLLSTMLLDFFATFFGGSMLLLPIFADNLLRVGKDGLGYLYAAQPVGALIAAVALASMPPIYKQGKAILVSVAVYGLAITVFGLAGNFSLALVALAISGAADTVSMVVRQTLRQLITPDEMRGRMTAVGMIFFRGGPQLGEVEAGVVAKLTDARTSVASGGVLCVIAVLATAWLVPLLRRHVDTVSRGSSPAGAGQAA